MPPPCDPLPRDVRASHLGGAAVSPDGHHVVGHMAVGFGVLEQDIGDGHGHAGAQQHDVRAPRRMAGDGLEDGKRAHGVPDKGGRGHTGGVKSTTRRDTILGHAFIRKTRRAPRRMSPFAPSDALT